VPAAYPSIVVLTGAGVSAESGVPTFRGETGLWQGELLEQVCTPQGLARNPPKVHGFYDKLRAALRGYQPNAAHKALAKLSLQWPGEFLLITQNVDDLHERAGTQRMVHMHGELNSALCAACGHRGVWRNLPLPPGSYCPACSQPKLRPDVVFFGEQPNHMQQINNAVGSCELFWAVGTSGQVYPAAGLMALAASVGAATHEFNLEPARGHVSHFAHSHYGKATQTVNAAVEALLAAPQETTPF
jgi:NAD-dependent deacetylase